MCTRGDLAARRGVDCAVRPAPRDRRSELARDVLDIHPWRVAASVVHQRCDDVTERQARGWGVALTVGAHHVGFVALRAVVVGLVEVVIAALEQRQVLHRPLVAALVHIPHPLTKRRLVNEEVLSK